MDKTGWTSCLVLIEMLCVLVFILTRTCNGKSIGLQKHWGEIDVSFDLSEIAVDFDDIVDDIIDQSLTKADSYPSKSREKRDAVNGGNTTDSTIIIQSTPKAITTLKSISTTGDSTQNGLITESTTSRGTTTPTKSTTTTTETKTTTITAPPTTTSSTITSTTQPTIPTRTTATEATPVLTTTADIATTIPIQTKSTTPMETASQKGVSETSCQETDALRTYFGKYGLIAFVVTLGVALILAFALCMFICMPKILRARRNRSKLGKTRAENVSDMRSPGAIYRPRPSLSKKTSCVPTPLAMIQPDDVTSLTSGSRKDSRVMTTDLDATSDPDMDGGDGGGHGNGTLDYSLDRKYSTVDRKFSTVSTTDNANVSTFLLRQASLRQEEDR